jgi:predicted esterase
LFEGAAVGSGQLVLTITQDGTNMIAQTGAWLDLHKIEDFYEQTYVTNVTSSYPPSDLASQYSVVHHGSGMGDETKQIIVYVHGINRPPWGAQNEGETMFKRLYWSGYRGHFAMFKWPCTYLPPNNWWPYTFNLSEFYAYKSATALRNYLTDLRNRPDLAGYAIDIIGHSQGSAVVSEALSQGAPFDNCILTQGAVPAHCYDGNAPTVPALMAAETQTPTPYYSMQGGYHVCWTNISGHIVNFFNTNDFALKSGSYGPKKTNWEVNQETQKPESFALGPTYSYWPASGQSSRSTFSGSQQVTDPQEIRSMVARSHSSAIGAQEPAEGQTGQDIIRDSVNLIARFEFGTTRSEHSAQFTRPIQSVWGYYNAVMVELGLHPTLHQ